MSDKETGIEKKIHEKETIKSLGDSINEQLYDLMAYLNITQRSDTQNNENLGYVKSENFYPTKYTFNKN